MTTDKPDINLKQLRLDQGWSIRGLARDIDVPEQSIRRLEAGFGVNPQTAKKVAEKLGVAVTDIPVFAERAA